MIYDFPEPITSGEWGEGGIFK